MNQRAATGLVLVLLVGLITHCADQMRVRTRYRIVPQQGPGRLLTPPSQPRDQTPGLLI